MMKNIIVPIDFSGDSINALEHAIVIANAIKSDIRMIHVKKNKNFEVPFYFKDFDYTHGDSLQDYFEILTNKYKGKVNQGFDFKIREGHVFREICNQAKYDDSYMIVIGTHGISGFEELIAGSNTFKVVANSPCPVLTVRHGFLRTEITKIVLPIDASKETRQKVPFIADIASFFNAEIHTVSVRETNSKDVISKLEKYSTQVCEFISKRKIKCHLNALQGNNITDITIQYACKIGAELICIMTEQSENPANIVLGAYAQQMVNHSPVPVLCIHPHN
jgi:nucleotide-binding universal stress UspA family protein